MSTNIEKVKKFTDWMNEGFCGKYNESNPNLSYQIARQLELANGVVLSIQASWSHYSTPRVNSPVPDYDFYEEFEIGFPSEPLSKDFTKYAENRNNLTGTVYCFVPKKLIQDYIDGVGGVIGIVRPPEVV